jgi:hypothetical protein
MLSPETQSLLMVETGLERSVPVETPVRHPSTAAAQFGLTEWPEQQVQLLITPAILPQHVRPKTRNSHDDQVDGYNDVQQSWDDEDKNPRD